MVGYIKIPEVKILPIERLYPHEELDLVALGRIEDSMSMGIFTNPIIVDRKTHVVLDGMHRFELIKRLGYKYVPCQLVDYFSNDIEVKGWSPTFYCPVSADKGGKCARGVIEHFCKNENVRIDHDVSYAEICRRVEEEGARSAAFFSTKGGICSCTKEEGRMSSTRLRRF